jgi:Uma2 family endonuclease
MASVTTPTESTVDEQHSVVPGPPDEVVPPELWFDRSSITIDAMVTIEGVSEEAWWRYAPEGRVCEFFDGVVYMPSPATREHQEDVGFWFFLLKGFTGERGLGEVLLGPGVLPLAPGHNPEPDVFVVPSGVGPHDPPAFLVVETLSNSTRRHDTGRKADAFRAAKIPEIVYVDLKHRRLQIHRRVDDLYTTEIVREGIWRSSAIPGFWIEVAWLWEEPLPNSLRCLQAILAGPPA